MRRIVTAREQAEMATPWQRTATPWHAKEGDPTYQVPTSDLIKHRQFNPAITTPQQMTRNLWQNPDPATGERKRTYDYESDFSSGGGSEGSNNGDSLAEAFESGQAHKLPPTEVVTNGSHALLSDGNHRAEMADTFSHPEMSSYIHYDPHAYGGDMLGEPVDPKSGLGQHIDKLVQNHPYEPVDGGPTTDAVFKRHPETNRWERGIVDHSQPPHFVDTPDYAKQMTQHVPGYKHDGLGTYFNVDFGNGPEITHERHLHARFERTAIQQPHPGLKLQYHPDQASVNAAYPGVGDEIVAPAVTARHPDTPEHEQPTGFLQWDKADNPERPNMVSWVDVPEHMRRQGIGAAMWEHAKQFNPDIAHSPQRSMDGDDWAHGVGGHIPPLMDDDDESTW